MNNSEITIPSIFPVACHTKNIGQGSTFVAIKGYSQDGLAYIPQAIAQGAKTIVVSRDAHISETLAELLEKNSCTLIRVDDPRKALAQLSAQAHGFPADKLKLIGITGTKGKTTSSFLLEHILRSAGRKTALLSTVKNIINGYEFPMQLTTPQPDYLHAFFKVCVENGVEYVVMEVAAQALSLHRTEGLKFDGVIFTNFDKEHAEFYPTLQQYFAAKCLIFDHIKENSVVCLNGDDSTLSSLAHQYPYINFFGLHAPSLMVRGIVSDSVLDAITVAAHWKDGSSYTFVCPSLIGTFNVYNLLGVTTLAMKLGIAYEKVSQACATFTKVPGRLERYHLPNGARCFIDYAHNPSSYQAVLSTLRSLTDNLIVVFGCGGDRDQGKRPLMGAVAAEFADTIILTSDNPRSENPAKIVQDIKAGFSPEMSCEIIEELDREKAIFEAYRCSKAGTIIVLLGKGPDEYQQIGTIKYPFSEAAIIRKL